MILYVYSSTGIVVANTSLSSGYITRTNTSIVWRMLPVYNNYNRTSTMSGDQYIANTKDIVLYTGDDTIEKLAQIMERIKQRCSISGNTTDEIFIDLSSA